MKHINKFNSIDEALNSIAYSPNVSLVLGSSNPDNIVYTNIGNGQEIVFVNDNGYVTGQKVSKAISEMTREEVHRYLYGESIYTITANDGTILGDYRGLYPQGESIIGMKPGLGDFENHDPLLLPWTFVEFLSKRIFNAEYTPFEITSHFHEDILINLDGTEYLGKFADLLSVIIQYSYIVIEDENGNLHLPEKEWPEVELERVGESEGSVFFEKPVLLKTQGYPIDGILIAPLINEDDELIWMGNWEDDSNAFYLTWKNPQTMPYDGVAFADYYCDGVFVNYGEQYIYYGSIPWEELQQ